MKGMTLLGIVLLALSAFLFYLTSDFTVQEISISHMMGIMAGIGIGLIIGGVIGYISKGSAIKEEARRKEFKRLQKEKEDLEKQALDRIKRESDINKKMPQE